MAYYDEKNVRRFMRDRDRGKVAGVCAGFADYFGFDLTMTRLLTIIATLLAGPVMIVIYVVLVLLVPVAPSNGLPTSKRREKEFRRELRRTPRATVTDVRRSLLRLDARLARMERYVTSPRFELDRKINDL
ncbi:MAG: envelope stress response membrane protein PspC [Pseudomonadota bacterium]